jgi:hypothetical protein
MRLAVTNDDSVGSSPANERREKEDSMTDHSDQAGDELIVAQTDGELLRGADKLSVDGVEMVQTAVALSSLLTTEGVRLFSAAFDDDFVIANVGGRAVSRTDFVERARALYFE